MNDPNPAPFTLENLSSLLATLIALSVAAERLVSVIKNLIPLPWLSTEQPDAQQERWRHAVIQVLSIVAGLATAYLANIGKVLPANFNWVLFGLLASGGSAFWTSVLGYVNNVKDIKKSVALDTKVQAAANITAIANGAIGRPPTALYAMLPHTSTSPADGGKVVPPADKPMPALDSNTINQANGKLQEVVKAALAKL